jgi:sugar phosphate isomerase/epimerase
MKLGISTSIYRNYSIEEAISRISSHGYEGIELLGSDPHLYPYKPIPGQIDKIKRMTKDHDLEIVAYTPKQLGIPINLCSPLDEIREFTLEYLREGIKIANLLDSPMMVVLPGRTILGQNRITAFNELKRNVKKLCEEAKNYDVKIAVEILPSFESNILNTTDDIAEFFEGMNDENLGLLIDVGCLKVAKISMRDVVEKLKGRVIYVHLNDSDGVNYHLPPGRGVINFRYFVRLLRGIGYEGFLTIELSPQFGMDPDEIAAESMTYAKRLLESA